MLLWKQGQWGCTVLTQIEVVPEGAAGVGGVLVDGVEDLVLDLGDGITV